MRHIRTVCVNVAERSQEDLVVTLGSVIPCYIWDNLPSFITVATNNSTYLSSAVMTG